MCFDQHQSNISRSGRCLPRTGHYKRPGASAVPGYCLNARCLSLRLEPFVPATMGGVCSNFSPRIFSMIQFSRLTRLLSWCWAMAYCSSVFCGRLACPLWFPVCRQTEQPSHALVGQSPFPMSRSGATGLPPQSGPIPVMRSLRLSALSWTRREQEALPSQPTWLRAPGLRL